ncbi:MAG TPA: hypothetical protein VFS43_23975 [Polyangiaceae bacterium]|nr:hypothetical protein [Polyangiaceae bacterium]
MRAAVGTKQFYSVPDLARLAELSRDQVRRMLERHGFSRPGGLRTRWLVSHVELMAKWPELVLSVKEVRAERLRAEAEARADAA